MPSRSRSSRRRSRSQKTLAEMASLPGRTELAVWRREFDDRTVKLDGMAAVVEQVYADWRSLKPFRDGYVAIYVDDFHGSDLLKLGPASPVGYFEPSDSRTLVSFRRLAARGVPQLK